jgi:hypothetical protein
MPAASQARPALRPAPPAAPESLDAGNLLWSIFKGRIAAFFRRLFK